MLSPDEKAKAESKTDEFPLEFHNKYEVLKQLGKVFILQIYFLRAHHRFSFRVIKLKFLKSEKLPQIYILQQSFTPQMMKKK